MAALQPRNKGPYNTRIYACLQRTRETATAPLSLSLSLLEPSASTLKWHSNVMKFRLLLSLADTRVSDLRGLSIGDKNLGRFLSFNLVSFRWTESEWRSETRRFSKRDEGSV